MKHDIFLKRLLGSCALAVSVPALCAPLALAQEGPVEVAAPETEEVATFDRVYVTGSRIQREVSSTASPVTTVTGQVFEDRGLTTAADVLNQITSLAPVLNQAAGDGSASGDGQQYAELFGLGPGRTLTLVNGRRFVTTSSGLGDAQVDANIIPTGLIEKVEVVQAGGAAVYGSDAIAGVVNFILKDDFEGVEMDLQFGNTALSNYETWTARVTAGTNFANDRGNVAVNIEGSSSPVARFSDFPASNRSRITLGNPLDTGPNDGIPSVAEVMPAYFWNFNGNGILYSTPAPLTFFQTSVNGSPVQFAPDGSLIPYDPGNVIGIPFAEGGEGTRYSDLAGLRTGVERLSANLIAHYDIAPNLRWNAELLYSDNESESVPQGYARTVLNQTDPALGAIMIQTFNPFLTDETRATLTSINPGFAAGAPFWLSRHFYDDLFPSNVQTNTTETFRLMTGLEGDFDAGNRNFYWTVSGSYAEVDGEQSSWTADVAKFNNAVAAFGTAANPVCFINVDGDPTNDDPDCAPLNPFGAGNISQAARDYVSVLSGQSYKNTQFDFLATIGTELFELPAGPVDVLLAYEHREEEASFTPFQANQLGLVGQGTMQIPTSGEYNTNEFSGEFLVPVLGGDFSLPWAQELELDGTYRFVDNSVAGEESVWSVGGRFVPFDGLTFRATRSRNFRAPSLDQLFAPANTVTGNGGIDPCDADRITAGPNPSVRQANCAAEWAANPQYGSLAGFQNPAENFSIVSIETGGNADLRNEVSDTTTFGFVLESFPFDGLTVSVDRVEIDLTDGLSAFTTGDFMAACYDSVNPSAEVCNAFTRLQVADGSNPAGTTATGRTTTFNAGKVIFKGEVYYASYNFELADIFSSLPGDIILGLEATHMDELSTSVTGTTFNRTDNTVANPDWAGRFNTVYVNGPLRLSYQLNYLDDVKASEGANIENNPNPEIDSNITHDMTMIYEVNDNASFRFGVTNLTDELPSYPTLTHGDILGRRYFAGLKVRF